MMVRAERRAASRGGFTLIELLVVVLVIGVLASMASFRYADARNRANREVLRADMHSLIKHQELHHYANGTYGTLAEITQFESSRGVDVTISYAAEDGGSGSATHNGLGSYTCGFFTGAAPPAGGAPATASESLSCSEES